MLRMVRVQSDETIHRSAERLFDISRRNKVYRSRSLAIYWRRLPESSYDTRTGKSGMLYSASRPR